MDKKKLLRSAVLFLVFYALFMAPWPGLRSAYASFYRKTASILFQSFGAPDVAVRFYPMAQQHFDIKVVFLDLKKRDADGNAIPFKMKGITSRYSSYMFVAFAVAMILATPVPWKRRALALPLGLIFMHVYFLAIKISIYLLNILANTPQSPIVFNESLKKFAFFAQTAFMENLVFGFMISLGIWVLVITKGDKMGIYLKK